MRPIYITGHRNPDSDSIAAAIGYAELKRRLDPNNEYVPVRLGDLNPQTRWLLDRSGAREQFYLRTSPDTSLGAVCAALAKWKSEHYEPEALLQVAMNVEAQTIKVPTGLQDYRPALYGGIAAGLFRAPGLELDVDRPDDLLLLAEATGETASQQLARELCVEARLACV